MDWTKMKRKKLIPIGTKIPYDLVKTIKNEIIPNRFVSMSDYLRYLIRNDLKERKKIGG